MYCPLAWHFCSKLSQNKIEKFQYRSLKLITNDQNSDYKFLLNKTGISTIEIKRLRNLAFEIFKTLNNLNPYFMKDIFKFSPYSTHRKHDIFVHSQNTSNYGDRSLRALDHIIGLGLNVNVPCASRYFIQNNYLSLT